MKIEISKKTSNELFIKFILPNNHLKKRLRIFGTGQLIDNWDNYYFLKTVQMPDGLVWHVCEVIE